MIRLISAALLVSFVSLPAVGAHPDRALAVNKVKNQAFGGVLVATVAKNGTYSDARILQHAGELLKALDFGKDSERETLSRLKAALKNKRLRRSMGGAIQGVFGYQISEVGFGMKVIRGSGLLRIKGLDEDYRLDVDATSIGAFQIGGSTETGIGLVTGLGTRDDFGGTYVGKAENVTLLRKKNKVTKLTLVTDTPSKRHKIYLLGDSIGVSNNDDEIELEITID